MKPSSAFLFKYRILWMHIISQVKNNCKDYYTSCWYQCDMRQLLCLWFFFYFLQVSVKINLPHFSPISFIPFLFCLVLFCLRILSMPTSSQILKAFEHLPLLLHCIMSGLILHRLFQDGKNSLWGTIQTCVKYHASVKTWISGSLLGINYIK